MAKVAKQKMYKVKVTQIITVHKSFKAWKPEQALEMANLKLEDIQAVELLGGGVRMPYVKKVLKEYFEPAKLELGQHLNGDEAMGLGAAFRAANISTAFRVRKVGVQDISVFGVSLKLETLPSKSEGFFGGLFGGKDDKKSEVFFRRDKCRTKLRVVPG